MPITGYLFHSCIYTIRHSQELVAAYAHGGTHEFVENKGWVSGKSFLVEARTKGRPLPIVFGPAEAVTGLIYAAIVTDIQIRESESGSETLCRYEHLTPLKPPLPLGSLWVINKGSPLDASFIRPYALCRTPEFLHDLAWE